MKTQIIQLDENDDYVSVRDKMNWIQTGRILLIWPKERSLLDQKLTLNLVKRHANRLGAQLALVTDNEEVNIIARQVGIPVFNSPDQAQGTQWLGNTVSNKALHAGKTPPNLASLRQRQRKSRADIESPSRRIFSIAISLLAILVLAVFILPGATILLVPQVETQSITQSVIADPSLSEINLSTSSLPAYLQEVIIEGSDSVPTTGSVTISDKAAFGSLRFTNISDHEVNIPAGTIVTTLGSDPVRFSTLLERILPSEESIILGAQATRPGTKGNLLPDSLVAIEGPLSVDLMVTNQAATSGGTDVTVPAPSELDLQQLQKSLNDKMEQASLTELQEMLPSGDILIPPSLKVVETLAKSSTPALGEPGSKLSLTMRVRYQSQVVSAEVLQNLVIRVLNASLPANHVPINGTTVINQVAAPTLGEDGKARWTVQAQRSIRENIATHRVIALAKGLPIQEVIDRLSTSLPLTEPAKITLFPSWWSRLPWVPMRIQVLQSESR